MGHRIEDVLGPIKTLLPLWVHVDPYLDLTPARARVADPDK